MSSLALAILWLYKVYPRQAGCSGVSMIDFLPFSPKLPITPALHWLLQCALNNDSSNSAHSSTHTKNIPCILTHSFNSQLTADDTWQSPGAVCASAELNLPSGGLRISRTSCICPSLISIFVLIQTLELAAYCFPVIYPDTGYPLQDCDKPKSTREWERSVPQNQLFHCPFLLERHEKYIWFFAAFKLQTKTKLLLNILFHLQGQLFCIIVSVPCASCSFYQSDCHICTHSHPPLIWKVQEGYCV